MSPPCQASSYTRTWSLTPGPEMPWLAQEESVSAIQLSPPAVVARPVGTLTGEVRVLPGAEVTTGTAGGAGGRGQGQATAQGEDGRGGGDGEALDDHEGGLPFSRFSGTGRAAYRSAARCSARVRSCL